MRIVRAMESLPTPHNHGDTTCVRALVTAAVRQTVIDDEAEMAPHSQSHKNSRCCCHDQIQALTPTSWVQKWPVTVKVMMTAWAMVFAKVKQTVLEEGARDGPLQ